MEDNKETTAAEAPIIIAKSDKAPRWTLTDGGVLTVMGKVTLKDGTYYKTAPWHDVKDKIKSVVLEEGVKSIGRYNFNNCKLLESVSIPSTITSIGHDSFRGCPSLLSVDIPNGVTSIGYYAFKGCSKLASVSIPDSVTSIGTGAFSGCSSLTTVSIPKSRKDY